MTIQADLEAQLAKLRAARSNGFSSVEHGDHRVAYKADSEMAAAISDIERRIAMLQGGRVVTTVLIHSSKGTCT